MPLEKLIQNMPEKTEDKLARLKEIFPEAGELYLIAIAENLKPEAYSVLRGVRDTEEFEEARKRLEMAGLSDFDKPGDVIGTYTSKGDKENKKEEINYDTLKNVIEQCLGFYNEKGKFILGGLAQNYLKADGLLDGDDSEIKKLNTAKRKEEAIKVYKNFQKEIKGILEGNSDINSAKWLIDQLSNEHLENKDKVTQRIREAYRAIPSEGLVDGLITAQVWDRDPLKDMSYCVEKDGESFNEFYYCAALGAHDNDEYASLYLRNGAVSMLDFKTIKNGKEKRLVRAITAAAASFDRDSLEKYMVIDSVEGTDAVEDKIILDALLNYSKKSGFDKIIFSVNSYMNDRARQFVDYVGATLKEEKGNIKQKQVKAQILFTTEGNEYIEAFNNGTTPKGVMEGYIIDLKNYDINRDSSKDKEKVPDINGDYDIYRVESFEWNKFKKDIMNIETKAFDEESRQDEDDIESTVTDDVSLSYVLRDKQEKVVGYLISSPLEDFPLEGENDSHFGDEDTVYLESIAILPENQSKGLSELLLEQFIEDASEEYSRITMHCIDERAIRSAQKLGFTKKYKVKDWHEGKDAWYMEKIIGDTNE